MARTTLVLIVTLLVATATAVSRPANFTQHVRNYKAGMVLPYQGGPIKTGNIPIYLIMYGDWSHEGRKVDLFSKFINKLADTPWWQIGTYTLPCALCLGRIAGQSSTSTLTLPSERLYKDKKKRSAGSGTLHVKSIYHDDYSLGMRLYSSSPQQIVEGAISAKKNKLPRDPSGVYVVLTAADVTVEGFCVSWCGYHDSYMQSKSRMDFAMVANPKTICPAACASGNPIVSPNGDVGIDAQINVLAHEVSEAVSDPALNAYITEVGAGEENGE
ncbi:phosphate-induced protein 1 [Jimgerdemannia flammicorona]|uniref:Phosphate-induced protein 1 n=2 Tax=Jimgerdemannia flammicorona TaxID=994334 RepID=A0A433PM01_9FUNG|nr:phosphate-induced protein 1 [Jimgerdemannia flammicorona]RUS18578.1 phosphate-induced protein 1 [Jimgerdemannia flammicorona]